MRSQKPLCAGAIPSSQRKTSTNSVTKILHRAIKELDSMLLFVSKKTASERLNLSGSTLKKYRLKGDWIEGIHWGAAEQSMHPLQPGADSRLASQSSESKRPTCGPIETYQKSLLSNQRKTRALIDFMPADSGKSQEQISSFRTASESSIGMRQLLKVVVRSFTKLFTD